MTTFFEKVEAGLERREHTYSASEYRNRVNSYFADAPPWFLKAWHTDPLLNSSVRCSAVSGETVEQMKWRLIENLLEAKTEANNAAMEAMKRSAPVYILNA